MKNRGLDKVDAGVSTCLRTNSLAPVGKRRGLDDLFPQKQTRARVVTMGGSGCTTEDRLIQAAMQYASSIS
jgi:hypothetical protein